MRRLSAVREVTVMLICLLAVNSFLAVLYAIVKKIRGEGFGMAFFFFFLPGFGFLLYFLPHALQRFLEKKGVDKETYLTSTFEIEPLPEHPDVQEALNVVPVEDAMAISGNSEKRALLLKQLKKDLKENYKILLAAEQDEDSESAHYVATAKMEIYRIQQQRWLECRRDYEHTPRLVKNYHAACEALEDMLVSGVLSAREQSSYQKRFCDLVQEQIDIGESDVSQKEYEGYLSALAELGRYEDAERLWQKKAAHIRSEASYRIMLKMFYQAGEREKFDHCLGDLRKDRQIRLSPEGLEQLRYWVSRLPMAAHS